MDQYQGIEDDLYAKKAQNENKTAEKLPLLTSDPSASRTKPASPSPKASSPSPSATASSSHPVTPNGSLVTATAQPNMVICNHDLDVYDPAHPTKLLGKFLKGSVIHLSSMDPVTGMIPVIYKQPNGSDIRALCRAEDVGR